MSMSMDYLHHESALSANVRVEVITINLGDRFTTINAIKAD